MNGGSNLQLALAVAEAGAFPSYWYTLDNDQLHCDLKEFIKCQGHSNIIVGGINNFDLKKLPLLKILNNLKISHVELLVSNLVGETLPVDQAFNAPEHLAGIKFLKKTSKILTRIYEPNKSKIINYFDAFCVKGSESAGKTSTFTVSDLFDLQKNIGTNYLIPYGGIGTPTQVRSYIDRGAVAVAVGTLLAASVESPLSTEVKQKLINLNSSDIVKIKATNQNSLILNDSIKSNLLEVERDWNRQSHLEVGLRGNGNEGLVYIGKSVDYIKQVKPVKDIIEYLVSEL